MRISSHIRIAGTALALPNFSSAFRSLPYTNNYIDNFSDLPLDVNGDGHIDIVSCSWFAHRLFWSENPGRGTGEWKEHMIETGSPVEFAFLVDLDNDGKAREVLPEFGDGKMPLAWYEAKDGQFVKHVVSPNSYGHGIGQSVVGPTMRDVNDATIHSTDNLDGKVGFVLVGCVVYRSPFDLKDTPTHQTRFMYYLGVPGQEGGFMPYIFPTGVASDLRFNIMPDGFTVD